MPKRWVVLSVSKNTEFGDYSSMSQSYKENELLLTTQLTANHTSVELMEIQREMLINRREGIRS